MRNVSVATELANLFAAIENCRKSGNETWRLKHCDVVCEIIERCLPHGSGLDAGVGINWDKCSAERIWLQASFHHMDENGYYDGWTDHSIIVTPTFGGIHVRVTGRDRNGIKDYIGELFHEALSAQFDHDGIAKPIYERREVEAEQAALRG